MPQNVSSSASAYDEIDLLDILSALWQRRILILIVTMSFAGLGLALALSKQPKHTGEVPVDTLNNFEMAGFDTWNQGVNTLQILTSLNFSERRQDQNKQSEDNAIDDGEIPTFTSTTLMNDFNKRFARGDALKTALRLHSKDIQDFAGEERDLNTKLNRLAKNFWIDETEEDRTVIRFITSDKQEGLQILDTAINIVLENAKRESIQSIQSRLYATEFSRKMELEAIEAGFSAMKQMYLVRKERSLRFMNEQASVARELDLKDPFDAGLPFNGRGRNSGTFAPTGLRPFESDYFLMGYRAIEKQISVLKQRTESNDTLFLGEADDLTFRRALLQQSSLQQNLAPVLSQIPLNDPEFSIVRIDLDSVRFETHRVTVLWVALATIVGLITSSVFVLVLRVTTGEKAAA